MDGLLASRSTGPLELAGLGVAGAKDVVVFAPGQMLWLGVPGEVKRA